MTLPTTYSGSDVPRVGAERQVLQNDASTTAFRPACTALFVGSVQTIPTACAAIEHQVEQGSSVQSRAQWNSQQGFTLIEAIVVIIIASIIAAVVGTVIRLPMQGYIDSTARAELTDVADTALRRMARDVRLALPNSLRTTQVGNDHYLELLLTVTGGRYLMTDDMPTSGNVLSFTNIGSNTFDVLGQTISATEYQPGYYIVVYNLGTTSADDPANAYGSTCPPSCNRAVISSVLGNTVTMTTNVFASQSPAANSSAGHFQVVQTPVTYHCANGALTRYWDYTIQTSQPLTTAALALGPSPKSALLANNVTACSFIYSSVSVNSSKALLEIQLSLQSSGSNNGGTVTLLQQVHVDNTP